MGASTEKKLRREAREAGTDKKILAAQEEAKKKAITRRKWTFGTVAVILLIAVILFLNSGFFYDHTTAVTIESENGSRKVSPAELNYRYAGQYMYFMNQYGSYAYIFGLDSSSGIAGLENQPCTMMGEDKTWKDYFMDSAISELVQSQALLDYAEANGIELTAEETAAIEAELESLNAVAKANGFSGLDNFLEANYGNGVDRKIALNAGMETALTTKVLSQWVDAQEYSDAELEEYYESTDGALDIFEYAYYYVAAESEVAEDGTSSYSEQSTADAAALAQDIMAAYKDGEGDDAKARLDAAVASRVEDGESYYMGNAAGSTLGQYAEWMKESVRKSGDITVIDSEDGSGSYVVVFISRNDNHYKMAQVRHILVMAEPSADGTYSDEAKAAAKAEAEMILAEFNSGDKSEESFAALAEQHSEDGGSNTNGGLYDSVIKGQMVEEFDKFCFEGHKKGDTAIVYGESSSYAGYHVMYYVGEGELYSDFLALNALTSADMTEWMDSLEQGYTSVIGGGMRFAG